MHVRSCVVQAVSDDGSAGPSSTSIVVLSKRASRSTAPQNVYVSNITGGEAVLTYAAPFDAGGSAITSYIVSEAEDGGGALPPAGGGTLSYFGVRRAELTNGQHTLTGMRTAQLFASSTIHLTVSTSSRTRPSAWACHHACVSQPAP